MAKLATIALASVLAVGGSSPIVVARIQTGASPGGAVSAFGSVWVATDGFGRLVRIDPGTNRITRQVRLRPGLFSVTQGFGAVWTINYKRRSLIRVDPSSGRTRAVRVGDVPFDVLAAFGRVWVTAWEAGTLSEIQPRSMRVLRRIRIGPRPAGLRAAAGGLWVGFGRSATSVARVNPATARIQRVPVGVRSPSWFAAGTSDLWIQADDNQLVRLDPSTRRVTARLSVGRTLAQGSLAPDGTIWAEPRLPHRPGQGSGRGLVRGGPRCILRAPRLRLDMGHELRRRRRLALCGSAQAIRARRGRRSSRSSSSELAAQFTSQMITTEPT